MVAADVFSLVAGAGRSRDALGLPDDRPLSDDLESGAAVGRRRHRGVRVGRLLPPVLAAHIALPLTVVVIVWIVMIDQIMGASRWALQGVLAVPSGRKWR